jgi:hypothetical protein
MEILEALLRRNGFLPHGTCFQWSPAVLWSMVGADVFIALAYSSIPLAILRSPARWCAARLRGAALAVQRLHLCLRPDPRAGHLDRLAP